MSFRTDDFDGANEPVDVETGREHDDIKLMQGPIDGADPAGLDAVDRFRDEDCVGSLDRVVEVTRDDESFAGNAVVRRQPTPEVGVDHLRWSWNGVSWQDSPGALLSLGRLSNGSYRLRYQAIDGSGNAGPSQELAFTVNTNLPLRRVYSPVAAR